LSENSNKLLNTVDKFKKFTDWASTHKVEKKPETNQKTVKAPTPKTSAVKAASPNKRSKK
jgi:hypothetical protein